MVSFSEHHGRVKFLWRCYHISGGIVVIYHEIRRNIWLHFFNIFILYFYNGKQIDFGSSTKWMIFIERILPTSYMLKNFTYQDMDICCISLSCFPWWYKGWTILLDISDLYLSEDTEKKYLNSYVEVIIFYAHLMCWRKIYLIQQAILFID